MLDLNNETAEDSVDSAYTEIVTQVLMTLSPMDYFTILIGNTNFSSTLLSASRENIDSVTSSFLPQLSFVRISQENLMERSFYILSNCSCQIKGQSAVVFITDRRIDRMIPSLVQNMNNDFVGTHGEASTVKVFVNSIGNFYEDVTSLNMNSDRDRTYSDHNLYSGSGRDSDYYLYEGNAELKLTCENNGIWNILSENGSNYNSVADYYRVLSRFIHIRQPILVELRNSTSGLLREGITLCLPVYNETEEWYNDALGVTCVAIPVSEIERFGHKLGLEVRKSLR